jgi:hypothetical protein
MNPFGFLLAVATSRKACMPTMYFGDRLSAFIHRRFIYIILSLIFILKSRLTKRKMKKGEFDDVFRYELDDQNWRPTYILP